MSSYRKSNLLRALAREKHSGAAHMPAASNPDHCANRRILGRSHQLVSGQPEVSATARPCLATGVGVSNSEYAAGSAVPQPKAWLIDLPTEILLLIGDFLPELHTLNCLARTHRRLTAVFSTVLFRKALKGEDGLSGVYLLCRAAQFGNYSLLLLLLDDYQIDVNAVSTYRLRTALHSASEYGQLSTAKFLLQRGANPDAQDFEGMTPLHLATEKGWKALIILLIENGASTELENHDCHTPLHYATILNNPDTLRLLLAMGSNPNRKVGEGPKPPVDVYSYYRTPLYYTALHIAVSSVEYPEAVIRVLVEYGADLEARDSFQFTPLGLIAHKLLRKRALWMKPTNAIWQWFLRLFELLLELGADFESAMESVDADACKNRFSWLRQVTITKFHKDLQAVYDRSRAQKATTRIPRIWFRHHVIENLLDTEMCKLLRLMASSEPGCGVDDKRTQYGKYQETALFTVRQWRRRAMAELTSVTKVVLR